VRRLLAAGAAVAAVLVGCASPVSGTPTPAPEDPAVTVELPPRPRDVPVDGIDPCTLLTSSDREELGLDFEPVLTSSPSGLYNGGVVQLCSIRGSEPAIRVGVLLSVTGGVELFLRPRVPAVLTPIEVAGFPALVADPTQFTEFCDVVVDTAPRQVLDVSVANGGRTPPLAESELCLEAERIANLAMKELLARS
jgi:hypothetical protein